MWRGGRGVAEMLWGWTGERGGRACGGHGLGAPRRGDRVLPFQQGPVAAGKRGAHRSAHGFLLSTCTNWRVSINAETRKGRSDIIVERKDRKIGFVVEVKDVKDEEKQEHTCKAAMKKIEEKDYTAILRRYRVKEIWTYGIAFWDKECRVAAKCIAR